MTQIINQIHLQQSEDVRIPQIDCKLKDRADFQEFLIKKKPTTNTISSSSKSSGAIPLEAEYFVKMVELHKSSGCSTFVCLVILQCMTGLRFDNVNEIHGETCEFVRSDCACLGVNLCNPIKNTCIGKLKFQRSKTGPIECLLLPQAIKCFQFIKKNQKTKISLQAYNKFIKENINCNYTSHSIRKFLVNLSFSVRGSAWASKYNFDTFYKKSQTNYVDLYFFLLELKWTC